VQLGVIILAAGASSRMGRPKLLLPWGRTTVIGHLLDQWKRLGADKISVVMAAQDQLLPVELDRLGHPPVNRILNPQPERGMFSSIQCAAEWTGWRPAVSHLAITLGDQPHLQAATLEQLAAFVEKHPTSICQPARQGRPRHPVVMPRPMFEQLAGTSAGTLKEFLAALPGSLMLWASDDPGLDLDLDEPCDYEQAHQKCFGRPP
jgi:molybdenum cofactor cytidylyltransferase